MTQSVVAPARPAIPPSAVAAPAPSTADDARPGRRSHALSVVVALSVLVLTVVLSVAAWQANTRSEQRLLDRQVAQVGTLLSNQAAVMQTEMADIGQVAVNTDASPEAFARFAARELRQTGQSLSLWRVTGGSAQRLATQGVAPLLPPGGAAALTRLSPTGQLTVLGILPGRPERLSYALMPGGPGTGLVVYAESPLPAGHRLPVTANSPLAGLDVALYLGGAARPDRLLESTAPTPIRGTTRTLTVPFGAGRVTIVGASPTHLTGSLSAGLPWLILGVGCVLAAGGAATLEFVSRRRAVAERLAAENARLYRQQRSIAGSLQHALLPAVGDVAGAQVDARYIAGVDELELGGDWFDVIDRGCGRLVFVVGDVSGNGMSAATTMAALRFAVRAYVAEGHGIEVVLAELRRLLDVSTDHQFATVLLGELDTVTGRLRVVSAGHPAPLLLTDGTAAFVDCPVAPPVGVDAPGPVPAATEVGVHGRTTLLAFSDGLVERRGEVIDSGLARLDAVARAAAGRPLAEMLDAALTVAGGTDDTVLVGIRWAEERTAAVA